MTHYRVHPLAPVLALDIDGTLAKYHEHFHWFAELYLQQSIEVNWLPGFEGEFSLALGLDKRVYRDIKLAYRQGGMKRSLPAFPDVQALVKDVRHQDVQVWIATTRPWLRLDNIDPDTQFWIERNLGRVDGLIYGEDKYADLIDIVGRERIVGVVDDLPENVIRARELDLRACLRGGPHNQWWHDNPTLRRPDVNYANHTSGIQEIVDGWIKDHKEESWDPL